MIRAIHRLAPKRTSSMFEGASKIA